MEKEQQAVNKFSEYLTECGFYFANISNPTKTLFGDVVPDSVKNSRIKDPNGTEEENNAPPKVKVADKGAKFANYLQIMNAVQ